MGHSTSRRALLRGLTVAPVVASAIVSPWAKAVTSLHRHYDDEPTTLIRTKKAERSAATAITTRRFHSGRLRPVSLPVLPA
jgi:hypothetical protein